MKSLFPKVVAAFGEEGSYTYQAFQKLSLSYPFAYTNFGSFSAVFTALEHKEANFALLPVENSTIGPIEDVHILLKTKPLQIVTSLQVSIEHALVGCTGSTIQTIQTIMAYPAVIEQCSKLIADHNWTTHFHHETAGAIRNIAARQDISLATLGPLSTAKNTYGCQVLLFPAQNVPENTTTFALYCLKA